MAAYFFIMRKRTLTSKAILARWIITILVATINSCLLFARVDILDSSLAYCHSTQNWQSWYMTYFLSWITLLCYPTVSLMR
ncbi:hypothetical protein L596_009488 [Steinernema carpocapsae]|uniref:Uncharacterized protein n=1 Tax=Steinernema carpocapsae TaxID=34508 RepID=A0A4U5PFH5_STECR|nr:hypothetical protein L596_009488 [Steinernema carpocapsae]